MREPVPIGNWWNKDVISRPAWTPLIWNREERKKKWNRIYNARSNVHDLSNKNKNTKREAIEAIIIANVNKCVGTAFTSFLPIWSVVCLSGCVCVISGLSYVVEELNQNITTTSRSGTHTHTHTTAYSFTICTLQTGEWEGGRLWGFPTVENIFLWFPLQSVAFQKEKILYCTSVLFFEQHLSVTRLSIHSLHSFKKWKN